MLAKPTLASSNSTLPCGPRSMPLTHLRTPVGFLSLKTRSLYYTNALNMARTFPTIVTVMPMESVEPFPKLFQVSLQIYKKSFSELELNICKMRKTKLSSEYFCSGNSSCRRQRSKSMSESDDKQRHESISNTQKQYASCWTTNSTSHCSSCLPPSTLPRKSKMFIRNMKNFL